MAQKLIKRKKNNKGTLVSQKGLFAKVGLVEAATLKNVVLPAYAIGDSIKLHMRIKEGEKERIQIFEGVVIGKYNKGASKTFTVRKISHGVGVERMILETSPKIAKMEVVQSGRVPQKQALLPSRPTR